MKIQALYIEITNTCNLNCSTCYNRSGLNRERQEISKIQLEGIIKLFSQHGLNRLLISGGEPTLHSEFNEILNLPEQYPHISFGIVTNGTNHNEELIKTLNARDNLTLQISLDGSIEEQNSKTRGPGNFDKAIEFIKKIHNPNIKKLLKMVVSQSNFDDVESFYKLALSVSCVPEYAFIYKAGNGSDDWENKCLSPQQKLKVLKLIDMLNMEYKTAALLPFCTSRCPYIDNIEKLTLCIKVNGGIQPCQSLYGFEYSLGNIFNFKMDNFVKKVEDISSLANKRFVTDYGCDKCLLQHHCGKGCMAMAVNLHGCPLADDGDCQFRKLQFFGYQFAKKEISNKKER